MRFPLASAVVLMLGAIAPAGAVSETAESFAQAMQGCWNRVTWNAATNKLQADPEYTNSSQICLKGGVRGELTELHCSGYENVECNIPTLNRYEFKNEKFWRGYEDGMMRGGLNSCDVRLEPGKEFELYNCQWATLPVSGLAVEDAIYERAAGQ